MKRAAILIGVDKTGDLPKLKDAARGARLMETWCRAQGVDPVVITDEKNPVTVDRIKKAIRVLVDAANVSQLLVYFAGHGVNLQRQEYWLLTDAPDDSQAAVNLATSVVFASTCGIPHVVFVSDACRTAPEGIRAQSIRGSEIFPNREEDSNTVDQFFACQLGKPSHEVRDPTVTAAEFKALYTNELVPALLGQRPQLVQWSAEGAAKTGRVHLRPLRDFLSDAVAGRLADLKLQTKVIQVPVAQINSDPPAWISQFAAVTGRGQTATPSPTPPFEPVATPESVTAGLLRSAMSGGDSAVLESPFSLGFGPMPAGPEHDLIVESQQLAQPFGPTHHETQCGFKLRGGVVVEFVSAPTLRVGFGGRGTVRGDDLRVDNPGRPSSNVLLVLRSGAGVLLPAIPDFLGALTFSDDGELVDVAYEPSDNTWRWNEYSNRAAEIRTLRAIASSAMARGSLKLEGPDALAIARRMQLAKGVDPSLALYAGYAYHDMQRQDLLHQMADYMQGDLGAPLFDVALLARRLDKSEVGKTASPVIGTVPLIAQGWTLLRAFEARLPETLAPLEDHRLPSLWTMFDAKGIERIRDAFAKGDIR